MEAALSEIIERVRASAASGTRLRIRGGGSKDFHGEAALGELLDTTALRGQPRHEPSELVVTVLAGTPLAELQTVLAAGGQCLPFEPPSFGGPATVGGMVACGLSGPARASVGSVRDYVLGLSLVNGRGELLSFGGQVMKNVAGYDVSRLMVGAFGTLGVIVDVSLKVLPVAPAEATLRFECGQAEALRMLQVWGAQPLPLNASRWSPDGAGLLHVRLRGAVAAVQAACARMGGERQPQEPAAADWQACREQSLPWFQPRAGLDLWRLSLPPTAPVLNVPEPVLVEWHGGQRWAWAEPGRGAVLRETAARVGGSATLFRRGGEARAGIAVFHPLAPPLQRIHRELKREFDPAGIFNPGRMYGWL